MLLNITGLFFRKVAFEDVLENQQKRFLNDWIIVKINLWPCWTIFTEEMKNTRLAGEIISKETLIVYYKELICSQQLNHFKP
jgi:hypothetical protein